MPLRCRCEAGSVGGTARENTRRKAGQTSLSLWNPASYPLHAGVTDKEPRGLGQIMKLRKVKSLGPGSNSVVGHMPGMFNTQKRRRGKRENEQEGRKGERRKRRRRNSNSSSK